MILIAIRPISQDKRIVIPLPDQKRTTQVQVYAVSILSIINICFYNLETKEIFTESTFNDALLISRCRYKGIKRIGFLQIIGEDVYSCKIFKKSNHINHSNIETITSTQLLH